MQMNFHTDHSECLLTKKQAPSEFYYLEINQGSPFLLQHKKENFLLFLLKGKLLIRMDEYEECIIYRQEIIFLPEFSNYEIKALRDSKILLLPFNPQALPCMQLYIEKLNLNYKNRIRYSVKGLHAHPEIWAFIQQILSYVDAGIKCPYMQIIKQTEIYILLKHFYQEEEIANLLYPSLGRNHDFTNSVIHNFRKAKTANELASKLGYGEKTFRKLFKQSFGTTPYKWMQEETAKQIYQRLIDKKVPFKQIMDEYGFSTSSHFHAFCKRNFDKTPKQIRSLKWLISKKEDNHN
ncbi:MAG: helix-turn-helix transcriptional regulator [Bacteroidales bacterium]